MTKLITLSGNSIETNKNDKVLRNVNLNELDPLGRTLFILKAVSDEYPGITWGKLREMYQNDKIAMGSAWYDRFGTQMKEGLVKGVDLLGNLGGDAADLLKDNKIAQGVARGAAAYASGGTSVGAEALFSNIFGPEKSKKIVDAFAGLSKKPLFWALGIIGISGLLYLILKKNKSEKKGK